MLNPIKTNHEMLLELAGMPHMAGGKRAYDVLDQYKNNIAHAIRKYTQLTGKPPTPAEIKALEDHLRGTANPAPQRAQTLARTAHQEKNADMLVDEFGRPYAPMVDPKTGKLTTPERAQGFTVGNQFEVNPQTMKARQKSYLKDPTTKRIKYDEVARPDEFVQVANVGRTSNRTNLRSTVPSTEELLAMQHNAENAAEELAPAAAKPFNETYGLTEGPTSASQVFADTSGAIEHGKLAESKTPDLREQLVLALNPQAGERVPRPLKAEIERARQSFLARGIEPDQEDIINAVLSTRNPAQHDYMGFNPISERPHNDPMAGKSSPEYLAWQDKMKAAGQPEAVWGRNPADWDNIHKLNYLLDTTPETRQPFAADWRIEDLIDRREKPIVRKAEGGFIPSTRDMQAALMVNGYDRGGRVQPTPEQIQRLFEQGPQYANLASQAYAKGPLPKEKSASERIADLGQKYLEKAGIQGPTARRLSQTLTMGGEDSHLPFGLGMGQIGMFSLPGFLGLSPVSVADTKHNIDEGNWGAVGAEAAMSYPGLKALGALGRQLKRNPRSLTGTAAATGAGATNANETQEYYNPGGEYRSVSE